MQRISLKFLFINPTSNYWLICLALLGADIVSNNTTSNILIKNARVGNFTWLITSRPSAGIHNLFVKAKENTPSISLKL